MARSGAYAAGNARGEAGGGERAARAPDRGGGSDPSPCKASQAHLLSTVNGYASRHAGRACRTKGGGGRKLERRRPIVENARSKASPTPPRREHQSIHGPARCLPRPAWQRGPMWEAARGTPAQAERTASARRGRSCPRTEWSTLDCNGGEIDPPPVRTGPQGPNRPNWPTWPVEPIGRRGRKGRQGQGGRSGCCRRPALRAERGPIGALGGRHGRKGRCGRCGRCGRPSRPIWPTRKGQFAGCLGGIKSMHPPEPSGPIQPRRPNRPIRPIWPSWPVGRGRSPSATGRACAPGRSSRQGR